MASLRKVRDIDIYRDETWYCGPGPSVVVYPDDEIVVAFRRSRTGGHGHPAVEACIVRSTDGGDTWSEPVVFDSGPIRNQNLTLLNDGALIVAMPSSDIITREVYEALRREERAPRTDVEVREYPGRGEVHRPRPGHLLPGRARAVRPPLHRPRSHMEPALLRRVDPGLGPLSCRASRPPSGSGPASSS